MLLKTNNMTAVEWLVKEIKNFDSGRSEYFSKVAIYNHAFRMEKEQIEKAYSQGALDSVYMPHKYYNDTCPTTRLSDSSNNIQIIK